MQYRNLVSGLTACLFSATLSAAQWSTTEIHLQNGELTDPFAREEFNTTILTFQHVSGWTYGDNFFFVDHLNGESGDPEFYGEWYSNFSLGKILDTQVGGGPIKDIGIVAGYNFAPEDPANLNFYLPGFRLVWDIEGFAFIQTDITAYLTDGNQDDNSFMIDCAWAYPISSGNQKFSIEGHIEYIGERGDGYGQESWILAQPQFRWDAGNALFGSDGVFYLGIEYQYWQNKLGVDGEDDNVAQLLAVWRL